MTRRRPVHILEGTTSTGGWFVRCRTEPLATIPLFIGQANPAAFHHVTCVGCISRSLKPEPGALAIPRRRP